MKIRYISLFVLGLMTTYLCNAVTYTIVNNSGQTLGYDLDFTMGCSSHKSSNFAPGQTVSISPGGMCCAETFYYGLAAGGPSHQQSIGEAFACPDTTITVQPDLSVSITRS